MRSDATCNEFASEGSREDARNVENPVDDMSPEDLTDALRRRLPGAKRHRGLALARARTPSERAWRLIGLAVALRHRRDYDEALQALDAAVALNPEPRAQRAAYLCAVTVHRDRGDYDAARRVSRSTPD
jgi:tetratricopeptide (TPR) repeat protein